MKKLRKIHYILLIVLINTLVFNFSLYELYFNEFEFSGFPNKFLVFIEAYLTYLKSDSQSPNLQSILSITPFFKTPSLNIPESSPAYRSVFSTASYFPNMVIFHVIVTQVSKIPPQSIMILPISAFFVPILYLTIFRKFHSQKEDEIYNIYSLSFYIVGVSLVLLRRTATTVLYAGSIGMILFLTELVLILKGSADGNGLSLNKLIIVEILIFFSLSQYWHTMLFFTWFLLLGYLISLLVMCAFSRGYYPLLLKYLRRIIPISIIVIVFNHLWQSKYLTFFFGGISISDIFVGILSLLTKGHSVDFPYLYTPLTTFWGKVFYLSTLLVYITLLGLLMLFSLLQIKKDMRNKRNNSVKSPILFVITIIIAEIMQILAYYKSQSIAPFYVFLYPPVLSLIFLKLNDGQSSENIFLKHMIGVILLLLIFLSILGIISLHYTHDLGRTPITKYRNTIENFEWLYYHGADRSTVISDFNIIYKYMQQDIKKQKNVIVKYNYTLLSPYLYGFIICEQLNCSTCSIKTIKTILSRNKATITYIIIDRATMKRGLPIDIRGSRGFLLTPYLRKINYCDRHNKIYEDEYVQILTSPIKFSETYNTLTLLSWEER